MRNRLLAGVLLAAILIVPSLARAEEVLLSPRPILFQNDSSNDRDSLWNGVLIGAGIGAAVGMLIAPQSLCGSHDTECATIVRVAIGLPAIAGGIGVGALVDGLMSRRDNPVRGVQVSWTF